MYAYHVVTDRPMYAGQRILFDENHPSGVFQRFQEKADIVIDIYAHPDKYKEVALDHHTCVALRELALEEVRKREYSGYPSRMHCLYVSKTLEEAQKWADYFAELGRPTYHIVKLKIDGNCFVADAEKCFTGQIDRAENLKLARIYWENPGTKNTTTVREMLVNGEITVLEIAKEINANIPFNQLIDGK